MINMNIISNEYQKSSSLAAHLNYLSEINNVLRIPKVRVCIREESKPSPHVNILFSLRKPKESCFLPYIHISKHNMYLVCQA